MKKKILQENCHGGVLWIIQNFAEQQFFGHETFTIHCFYEKISFNRFSIWTKSDSLSIWEYVISSGQHILYIPFHATDLFWYPLKTSENFWFFDVFRGYQKRSVAWNGICTKLIFSNVTPEQCAINVQS